MQNYCSVLMHCTLACTVAPNSHLTERVWAWFRVNDLLILQSKWLAHTEVWNLNRILTSWEWSLNQLPVDYTCCLMPSNAAQSKLKFQITTIDCSSKKYKTSESGFRPIVRAYALETHTPGWQVYFPNCLQTQMSPPHYFALRNTFGSGKLVACRLEWRKLWRKVLGQGVEKLEKCVAQQDITSKQQWWA